jgi:hypothetical protein
MSELDALYERDDPAVAGLERDLYDAVDLDTLDHVTVRVVVSEAILPIREIAELTEEGAAGFVAVDPHEREPHEDLTFSTRLTTWNPTIGFGRSSSFGSNPHSEGPGDTPGKLSFVSLGGLWPDQ